MSNQVNPALEVAEDLFKSIAWDTALQMALAALFAYVPVLAVPPLKQIISGLAGLASDAFYKFFKMYFDCGAIVFLNAEHQAAFTKATVATKIIGVEKGVASPEYKKSKEAARAAFIAYSHFNG
jgi:hypothetical protein